ncbi:hypothetical protein SacmaDRAFT_5598 [Saccharomonospora marina XMU15]|uniref:PE domain-containing protein n=1 Tax=Saccharomonospora marina XMU15 TaxID=882083 RepID=H5XA54_9PSEU|nr:PE domain-containing protein [Saccharomonospora marina]EHR53714.1 hypothetical protein SacmaDRAFT_5598 [Saccharomonospora marina XMU15]
MSRDGELPRSLATMFGSGGGTQLAASVPPVPGVADLRVAPDQILAVAKVIEEQAAALQRELAQRLAALRIPPPSQDVVSTHAVQAWNQVIAGGEGSYEQRVRSYVRQLRDLAEQLRAASAEYGVSEEEKAAAFGDRRGFHG